MVETSHEDFMTFKARVFHWCSTLEITGWHVHFLHQEVGANFAELNANYRHRTVTFSFNTNWPDNVGDKNGDNIDKIAKHEALHLLTIPLCQLALERFVTESEIFSVDEELICRLESLIPNL